jgi:hypothetical protein
MFSRRQFLGGLRLVGTAGLLGLPLQPVAADLYFECHDVADYDQPTRTIINNSFLAGTLRHVGGTWVFYDMSAGPSTPLSLERYYA